ncbi:MAG: hypothetical protein AAGA93_11375 [Actinomycetota bacterium]
MNAEELDAMVASANPHPERTAAGPIPPVVGEAMLREITETGRGTLLQRLTGLGSVPSRARGRAGFVTAIAVVVLAVLAVNLTSIGGLSDGVDPAGESAMAEECRASGPTLNSAKQAYAEECSQPRLDCDPIDGEWICSNLQIGRAAPNPGTIQVTSTTAPPTSTTVGSNPSTTAPRPTSSTSSPSTAPPPPEPCTASGDSWADAVAAYDRTCDEPRVDCDPIDGEWLCSSQQIGDGTPLNPPVDPGNPGNPVNTTTTVSPRPTTVPPTTAPRPVGGNCIVLEAESLDLVGDWIRRSDTGASGGAYITWEGLSRERNNGSPDDVLSTRISVSQAGTYRFVWSMRQPGDVASDKANDSWVNFPDANRFGPTGGGSYGGYVKVFGNGKGNFAWAATADQNHKKTQLAIEFSRPGTYTFQLAGRSHGHQIDKIVIHHDSVSRSDAINGRCGSSNPNPQPPNPNPNPNTGTLGRFDIGKDLLLCNYDSKPDEDDLHAVAGLATMLSDSRFAGVDYHCTAGAYGRQGGRFLDEPKLFDLAFGRGNWASADANRDNAVLVAADKAIAALDAGGDVWVTEAGQSDVTARIVKRIASQRPGVDTEKRIHVVQHSNWNENQTTPADLTYVRNNTDYLKIADGNGANNGTPQLTTSSGQYWSRVKGDADVGAVWTEADAAARRGFDVDWNNDKIVKGGMDFSDTVEPMYVFGFERRSGNVGGFFDEFL